MTGPPPTWPRPPALRPASFPGRPLGCWPRGSPWAQEAQGAVPALAGHALGTAAGRPAKYIWTFRLRREGCLSHLHSFGCGDARGESKAFGSLGVNWAETESTCRMASPFLTHAPRDICYSPAYAEVFFWERSPKSFSLLDHLFPCTQELFSSLGLHPQYLS